MDFRARIPDQFDPKTSGYTSFVSWRRSLEDYILASNAFPDNLPLRQKHARLFNIAGSSFASFIRESEQFKEPVEQEGGPDQGSSIIEILEICGDKLRPQRQELQFRKKLLTRRQQHGESAQQFLCELRSSYRDSGYGEFISRDVLLRDLLVAGMESDDGRRLLYQRDSTKLSLDETLMLISSFENGTTAASDSMVCAIKNNNHREQRPNTGNFASKSQCIFCGGSRHPRSNCPASAQRCHKCHKQGHFARVCRGTRQLAAISTPVSDDEPPATGPEPVVSVINGFRPQRKWITAIINGHEVRMLLDTGSDITVLSEAVARYCNLRSKPITGSRCYLASGQMKLAAIAHETIIRIGSHAVSDNIYVTRELHDGAILGNSYLSQFRSLTVSYGGRNGDFSVCPVASDSAGGACSEYDAMLNEYSEVFDKVGFAKIEPVSAFDGFPSQVQPVRAPSRRYAPKHRDFIRAEVVRLEKEGKIRPSRSSWRSQILVVDQGEKMRLVVDYAPTVNKFTPLDAYPMPLVDDVIADLSKFSTFSYIDLKSAFNQLELRQDERHFTAFEANGALFEFNCLPFGLRNSPACFSRAMRSCFGDLQGVLVYMDDIVVGGSSRMEHDANLRRLLQRIKEKGLSINSKSVFLAVLSCGFWATFSRKAQSDQIQIDCPGLQTYAVHSQ